MHQDLPLYPALVIGDIFSVKQLIGRRVFAQAMLRSGARIHEGLSDHRETSVCDAALMNVKHKLRVLDHIYPETQRKAGTKRQKEFISENHKVVQFFRVLEEVLFLSL